ncbi:MAG: site-specific integrase [Defluviitaleaceae bacterium]|nr:site-specific integrase [Defluviitaleaceae bacterium]
MNPLIDKFLNYMAAVKNAGDNTLQAYRRDLGKLEWYLSKPGGQGVEAATSTALMAYMLHLHKSGKHASTISRNVAVIKSFYRYLYYEREISRDPAYLLKPPKVLRDAPPTLSQTDRDKLLNKLPSPDTGARSVRNQAITALIFFTDIRVGTLIELNMDHLDIDEGLIRYKNARDEAEIKLEPHVLELLKSYIDTSRPEILKDSYTYRHTDKASPIFVNMQGRRLSRQGLWKIVKEYGRQAQLEHELSPRLLKGAK